eukprot:14363004-Ditylum_brightwellii.AAC.1
MKEAHATASNKFKEGNIVYLGIYANRNIDKVELSKFMAEAKLQDFVSAKCSKGIWNNSFKIRQQFLEKLADEMVIDNSNKRANIIKCIKNAEVDTKSAVVVQDHNDDTFLSIHSMSKPPIATGKLQTCGDEGRNGQGSLQPTCQAL